MSCFKSSLALLLFSSLVFGANVEKFSSKACLEASFEASVTHKGDFWGLMKNDLYLKKDVCEIVVKDKGLLDSDWKVDVCREPIHIKETSKGSLSVYKRGGAKCDRNSSSEFCESWKNLKSTLEDKGLIFAEGEREKLSSAHGKIYCAYLLLKKHLDEGDLFSKYQEPVDLYSDGNSLSSPVVEEVEEEKEKAPTEEPKKEEKVEAQGRF